MRFVKILFCLAILFVAPCVGSSQAVYKTPSGAKYHLASCRMVNNVSEKITLEQAAKLGLSPCKICKPAPIAAGNAPNKEKGENETVQCKGMTKKGTRCLHRTRIANGYCFQHNPDE